MKIEFYRHNLGSEEIKEATKVLKSLFLTTGKYVDDFEEDFAKYLKADYAVGLTSCTAALHLALLAAGVGPGDEVITTPMSFVATSNAICMTAAKPVFVDVEKNTANIDATLIEKAITKKTKAILPVHMYGQMADIKQILAIAKKHNLIVIEDAAHALESERDGIRPGQKSFGSCFSFYATKSITSAEGGAFTTNSEKIAKLVKKFRSHGISSELAQRMRTGLRTYDVDVLGWKYNMDNLQASLLLPQVKRAEKFWSKREKIAQTYRKAFTKIGIEMPHEYENSKHGRHIFPIWVDAKKRDTILEYLLAHGVAAVINYPAIHLFTYYRNLFGFKPGMFPNTEEIANRTISLPLYSKLKSEEIKYIIKNVIRAVKL
ncbi:DegT/DnrJ/EryC1/StrS family aminotransferase [Candidatus Roizmanbacteria bacterium]|nr:DegT/DnrJ/EryC1/StrS family aminotransferase [Candidatus Roizmanbacteria bacterium]